MKIIAFVVTHNRILMLPKVVSSLKSQTQKIDEIVVINNSSTDGTLEWLNTQSGITIITQENLGGAGGFNKGVQYAYENEADWIWMMDDDVYPQKDSLEKLLNYKDFSDCIIPSRIYSDGIDVDWGGIYDLEKHRLVKSTRTKNVEKKPFYFVNTCCFEGTLISSKLVSKIDYPDKRFFISGDDTTYGLKASVHTNIILVKDAVLERDRDYNADKILSPMFLYYNFRNTHLLSEYNLMINKKSSSLIFKLKICFSVFLRLKDILFNNQNKNKLKLLKAMFNGLIDSYYKKIGPTHHNRI